MKLTHSIFYALFIGIIATTVLQVSLLSASDLEKISFVEEEQETEDMSTDIMDTFFEEYESNQSPISSQWLSLQKRKFNHDAKDYKDVYLCVLNSPPEC
ncbi:MAG: hypothetical protein ACI9G9_000250 [Psychromonas sp.]|jgi:hypothetical protein